MSDIARDYIRMSNWVSGKEEAIAFLDAERAEHARQVEDIKFRCTWLHSDLEQQVADLNGKLKAWDAWYALFGDRDLETQIIDLQRQLEEANELKEWYANGGKR